MDRFRSTASGGQDGLVWDGVRAIIERRQDLVFQEWRLSRGHRHHKVELLRHYSETHTKLERAARCASEIGVGCKLRSLHRLLVPSIHSLPDLHALRKSVRTTLQVFPSSEHDRTDHAICRFSTNHTPAVEVVLKASYQLRHMVSKGSKRGSCVLRG